jgi:ParB-like chromosome segregation protein Spo0J
MARLAERIQAERLSVRSTEELVREYLSGPQVARQTEPDEKGRTPGAFDEASRIMREALGLPVRVKQLRSGGKIEIRFNKREELETLLTRLTPKGKGRTK